tara:strand:+ start:686 stop:1069 length:384 start_codon:yes stop_codon:yes gene_type:complete
MDKIKIPSNRNFGLVFFTVFIIISLFPLLKGNHINYWTLIISFIFLILGLLNSNLLDPLNRIWFKFGLILGKVISPVVMGIIFFLVITPIGMLLKLFKKDVLNLKKNQKKSYWIKKDNTYGSMKKQF